MLNMAGLMYLGSRAASAAGNLLAVMIFTRLAGPAEYGHYVLIFAWSLIVYGFGAQWMRFAFFGVYHPQRFGEYVTSLGLLLGCGVVAVALSLTALGVAGLFEPGFLVAVFAMVCGITVYEAAFEVSRTLLYARGVALSMLLRATLSVTLGSASLWLGGGARGLAFAIALTHIIASIPSFTVLFKIRLAHASRAALMHILTYGWPLLLSFGVSALGQTIDRLLLARYLGTAALGPYGVVADLLRQSFTVFGEVIILSFITVAKRHANDGNLTVANFILQKAFNSCLAVATFGAAFFIVFGDRMLHVLLRPEFIAPTSDLIPIFAVGSAFVIMRDFYFAQVIYFTHASYLDLLVNLVFLAVSTTLSLLLIPTHGLHGAAIAMMVTNIISCFSFMMLGRRWFRLPIDFTGLATIPALAALFVFGAYVVPDFVSGGHAPLILDAIVFVLFGTLAIRRFGVLGAIPTVAIGDEARAG
jgi:O-antigen/teichoic acid export membrane protein